MCTALDAESSRPAVEVRARQRAAHQLGGALSHSHARFICKLVMASLCIVVVQGAEQLALRARRASFFRSATGLMVLISGRTLVRELPQAPPTVAFIVAGLCRGEAETRRQLKGYVQNVLVPHAAASNSTLFLFLTGDKDCGPAPRCSALQATLGVRCVEDTIDQTSCPRTPRHPECFQGSHFPLWRWWCTMQLAWQAVRHYERQFNVLHDRVVVSRVDLNFSSSMGSWSSYREPWHSSNADCPDMFWALSRNMAARVLSTLDVAASCQPGDPCCNQRFWHSWWPWYFWMHPHVVAITQMPPIHGIPGSFDLEAHAQTRQSDRTTRDFYSKSCYGLPFRADRWGHLLSLHGTPVKRMILDNERHRICRDGSSCYCNWNGTCDAAWEGGLVRNLSM